MDFKKDFNTYAAELQLQASCYHETLTRIGSTDGEPDYACTNCGKVF